MTNMEKFDEVLSMKNRYQRNKRQAVVTTELFLNNEFHTGIFIEKKIEIKRMTLPMLPYVSLLYSSH